MSIRGFAAVARLRWLFLSGVLVLAVVLGIAAETGEPQLWVPAAATLMTLTAAAIALSVRASRYRPAALTVSRRGQAFIAPSGPQHVFQAAAITPPFRFPRLEPASPPTTNGRNWCATAGSASAATPCRQPSTRRTSRG